MKVIGRNTVIQQLHPAKVCNLAEHLTQYFFFSTLKQEFTIHCARHAVIDRHTLRLSYVATSLTYSIPTNLPYV